MTLTSVTKICYYPPLASKRLLSITWLCYSTDHTTKVIRHPTSKDAKRCKVLQKNIIRHPVHSGGVLMRGHVNEDLSPAEKRGAAVLLPAATRPSPRYVTAHTPPGAAATAAVHRLYSPHRYEVY